LLTHLHFCQHTNLTQKNAKELPNQRTEKNNMNGQVATEKNNEGITAPTRNWRFSGKMKLCASYQVLCFDFRHIQAEERYTKLENV